MKHYLISITLNLATLLLLIYNSIYIFFSRFHCLNFYQCPSDEVLTVALIFLFSIFFFILEIYFQNKIKVPSLGFKIVAVIFKVLNILAFISAIILCFIH